MPITQERMLACINAGLSAFAALELAKQITKEQTALISAKLASPQFTLNNNPAVISELKQMLQSLEILITPEALVNQAGTMSYFEAWHQLDVEARHFRAFKSINARAKKYHQNKRQKQTPSLQEDSKPTYAIDQASLYQQEQALNTQRAKEKFMQLADGIPTIQDIQEQNRVGITERLVELGAQEREFISKYRALTTTAPTVQEIAKYLANPNDYKWPLQIDAEPSAKRADERDFFRNYQPEDL